MTGANLMSSTGAIGDLLPFMNAAYIAGLILIVSFVVFLRALQAPKASSKFGDPPHLRHLQNPSSVQKKKGHRAKKGRKARGTASKPMPGVDDGSEEEAEVGTLRSSSDLEAPSIPSSRIQKPIGGDADNVESVSESEDIEIRTDPVSAGSECDYLVTLTASKETNDPCEADTADEAHTVCMECAMPDVHIWGCSAHRTYTSSLLLMHREIQARIARGPPGLDPPAGNALAPSAGVCSLRVA